MLRSFVLALCSFVNVYLLGVMVVFAAVLYPMFGAVDRPAFVPLYEAFTGRIGAPVVISEFAALATTLLLYARRPPHVTAWAVHGLVVLGVAYFAVTFGWQLPAHRALAAGDNATATLAPLLSSQWVRTGIQLARVALLGRLSTRPA